MTAKSGTGCLLGAGFILIVVLMGGSAIWCQATSETITITVTKTERIVEGGEVTTSKYLVFTDGEVFENTDALWFWKWDSSDLYGKIEAGKTYRAKVYGWRVPFLSMYRNIVWIVEQSP